MPSRRDALSIPLPPGEGAVPMPTIRLSTAADRDRVLAFIARMGFNPRDAVTWDGLNMCAMTAWVDDRLVGAIPLELRLLRVSPTQTIQSLHETVVAVEAEHRSAGLGSQMQQALFDIPPHDARLVTVFREDPASAAYRWYIKNGFTRAMQIQTWAFDEPAKIAGGVTGAWHADDPALPWREVEQRWAVQSHRGGVVDRASRPLRRWIAVHPYRNRYEFQIVADVHGGYALLGVGQMHSQTPRVELLEMMPASDDPAAAESVVRAAAALAARVTGRPLRLPLASGDPLSSFVQACGARVDWSFDMLARAIVGMPLSEDQTAGWRYAGIDFI